MTYLTVRPAYGVQLNSQQAILDHYADNKDFEILSVHYKGGRYLNKEDVERQDEKIRLEVRYGKYGSKVMIIETHVPDK